MVQLFSHLISNAVKFTKPGLPPLIRIYSKEVSSEDLRNPLLAKGRKRYVEIVVEDNGIGIEPSQLDKIYDIFARGTSKRVGKGFGMGLAFCRKIVHNHGGMIKYHPNPGCLSSAWPCMVIASRA